MAEENEKRILKIFTIKSDDTLLSVLEKNRVASESLQAKITADLVNKNYTEKDISDLIQKEAGVAVQDAQNIAKEVINIVVPTIKEISQEDLSKMSEKERDILLYGKAEEKETPSATTNERPDVQVTARPIRPPIEVEKILNGKTGAETTQKFSEKIEPSPAPKKRPGRPATKKPAEILQATEQKPQPTKQTRGPDRYRESIE